MSARSLITTTDLSPQETLLLLDDAATLREQRRELVLGRAGDDTLRGRTVALVFEKPSTRTRVSFEVGVRELGGTPLALSSADLQLGRGETELHGHRRPLQFGNRRVLQHDHAARGIVFLESAGCLIRLGGGAGAAEIGQRRLQIALGIDEEIRRGDDAIAFGKAVEGGA